MNDFAMYLNKAVEDPSAAGVAIVVLYLMVFCLRYVPAVGAWFAAERLRMRVSAAVLAFAPYVIIGLSGGGWDVEGIATAVMAFLGATGLDKLFSGSKPQLPQQLTLFVLCLMLCSCAALEKTADDAADLMVAGSDVSNYVDPKAQHARQLAACGEDAQCIEQENAAYAACMRGLATFRRLFCDYIGGC